MDLDHRQATPATPDNGNHERNNFAVIGAVLVALTVFVARLDNVVANDFTQTDETVLLYARIVCMVIIISFFMLSTHGPRSHRLLVAIALYGASYLISLALAMTSGLLQTVLCAICGYILAGAFIKNQRRFNK